MLKGHSHRLLIEVVLTAIRAGVPVGQPRLDRLQTYPWFIAEERINLREDVPSAVEDFLRHVGSYTVCLSGIIEPTGMAPSARLVTELARYSARWLLPHSRTVEDNTFVSELVVAVRDRDGDRVG